MVKNIIVVCLVTLALGVFIYDLSFNSGKMDGCKASADYFLTGFAPSFVESLQIKGTYDKVLTDACNDILKNK